VSSDQRDISKAGLKRKLGFPAAIAMVVGTMIGSGIFMSPQNLAAVTNPKTAMLAWAITGAGSVFIAMTFANMVTKIPKTGGPVVYTRVAFGGFPSFLVGWSYWIGTWTSLGAIINGCVRYLGNLTPVIGENKAASFIAASAILWLIIYINVRGIKQAGSVVAFTTICKLVPLALFLIIGLFHFHPEFFNTAAGANVSGADTLSAAIGVTLWSFMGLEMGVFPAEETKNAPVFIRRATIFGTIFVAVVYVVISTVAFGIMPQNQLAHSQAPIADMLDQMTGGRWGGIFISLGVIISTFGAATGCAIVTARCSYACAVDKTFPAVFKKINMKYGTPETSLIIAGLLTNILFILNYVKGLNAAYQLIMLLSTMSTLPAYIATAGAEIRLAFQTGRQRINARLLRQSIIPFLALVYSGYAVYGCGRQIIFWGVILMLLGIPLYLYVKIAEQRSIGRQ
jgi:amino acid transporter